MQMKHILSARLRVLLLVLTISGLCLSPMGLNLHAAGDDLAALDFVRYGLFVDQQDLGAAATVYGNLAGFFVGEGEEEPTTAIWYPPGSSAITQSIISDDEEASVAILESILGKDELGESGDLYTVTHLIYLTDCWLSAGILQGALNIDMSRFNRSLIFGKVTPLEGNFVGTGVYEVTYKEAQALLDYAGVEFLLQIHSLAEKSVGATVSTPGVGGRTFAEIDSGVFLRMPKTILENDPVGYATTFMSSPYEYTAEIVTDDDGKPLLSKTDSTPLYSVNAVIPIHAAVRMPSTSVTAKVYSVFLTELEDGYEIDEIVFDVSQAVYYSPAICEGIVLGWSDDKIVPDMDKILQAVAGITYLDNPASIESLRRTAGAEKAFFLPRGEMIRGAATATPNGYKGITLVVLYTEVNTVDLVLNSIESTVPPAGYLATARMEVVNTSEFAIFTQMSFNTSYYDAPITWDVLVNPGINYFTMTYSTPPDGREVVIQAEINPFRNPKETEWRNNALEAEIDFTPVSLPYNVNAGRSQTLSWQEQRRHTITRLEVVGTSTSASGTAPLLDWRRYTCTHDFFYECEIDAWMELEYRDDLYGVDNFYDLLEMKAGYGFTPHLHVEGSGPVLVEEMIAGIGTRLGEVVTGYTYCPLLSTAPSKESEAILVWPNIAVFSWIPSVSLGNNYEHYEVISSEYGSRFIQPSIGIGLKHEGTTVKPDTAADPGATSLFTANNNPVSGANLQRIYTNVALRDGRHFFSVEIDGGRISYGTWQGLLGMDIEGGVSIKGVMYEDDYTGSR